MVPGNGIIGHHASGKANAKQTRSKRRAGPKQTQKKRKASAQRAQSEKHKARNIKQETQSEKTKPVAASLNVYGATARARAGLTDMGIPTSWQILMISMSNAQRSRWSEPNTTAAVSLVNSLKPVCGQTNRWQNGWSREPGGGRWVRREANASWSLSTLSPT